MSQEVAKYFKQYSVVSEDQQRYYDDVNAACLELCDHITKYSERTNRSIILVQLEEFKHYIISFYTVDKQCMEWALEAIEELKTNILELDDLTSFNPAGLMLAVKMYLNLGITIKAHGQ